MRRGASLPWLALALLFVVPATWLLHDKRGLQHAFPAGSIRATREEGASLAFAYLTQREHRAGRAPVRVLDGDLAQAPIEMNAVLFRVQPPGLSWLQWLDDELGDDDEKPSGKPAPHGEHAPGASSGATGPTEPTHRGDAAHDGATPASHDADRGKSQKHAGSPDDEDSEPDGAAGEGGDDAKRPAALADEASLRFVHGGGRLVLAIARGSGAFEVTDAEGSGDPQRVHPDWPGVNTLKPPLTRVLEGAGLHGAHALFAIRQRPVIARVPLGRGDIVVLACPEILENMALAEADHLALLEALAPDGRPIWFDEHVHGAESRAGVMSLLREAKLGPFVLVGALAALVGAWRAGTRVGPPEDPHRERRSEAVDSVARLYERSLRRRDALALYRRSLVHDVALREGLRDERLDARVRELTRGLDALADAPGPAHVHDPAPRYGQRQATADVDPREFARMLNRLNEAHGRLDSASRRRTPRIPHRPA